MELGRGCGRAWGPGRWMVERRGWMLVEDEDEALAPGWSMIFNVALAGCVSATCVVE